MDTAWTLDSVRELVAAAVAAGQRSGLLHLAQSAPLVALALGLLSLTATVLLLRALVRAPLTLRAVAWKAPFSRRLSHWVQARDYTGDALFLAD